MLARVATVAHHLFQDLSRLCPAKSAAASGFIGNPSGFVADTDWDGRQQSFGTGSGSLNLD